MLFHSLLLVLPVFLLLSLSVYLFFSLSRAVIFHFSIYEIYFWFVLFSYICGVFLCTFFIGFCWLDTFISQRNEILLNGVFTLAPKLFCYLLFLFHCYCFVWVISRSLFVGSMRGLSVHNHKTLTHLHYLPVWKILRIDYAWSIESRDEWFDLCKEYTTLHLVRSILVVVTRSMTTVLNNPFRWNTAYHVICSDEFLFPSFYGNYKLNEQLIFVWLCDRQRS